MEFKYNYFGFPEPVNIYLCKTDNTIICELNGVDRNSVSYTKQLNNIDTLQFDVHKYVNGEESNGYDLIDEAMYLRVDNIGYFRMSYPEISNDGYDEYKSVTAQSCDCELQLKSLVGFKINCGSADSLEYLYDKNVKETDEGVKIAINHITLINEEDHNLSLLHLALEKCPGWTIGTVDKTVAITTVVESKKDENGNVIHGEDGKPLTQTYTTASKRTFDIDSKSVYAFFTQDVSKKFECIFDFDIFNRKINVVSLKNYGIDSNVQIGYTNLIQELKIAPATEDNIFTRFAVRGGDDLTIDSVNFGSSTIEDLSYFLNTRHVSDELIDKYNDWINHKNYYREPFIVYMKERNTLVEERDELKYRVPNDGVKTNWKQFTIDDLKNKIKPKYKGYMDALKAPGLGYWDSKNNKWLNLGAKQDYESYEIILKEIDATIKYKENISNTNASSQLDAELEELQTNWDLYGSAELENKIKAYNENLEALEPYAKDWKELNEEEKKPYTEKSLTEAAYNIAHSKYVKYLTWRDECTNALNQRNEEIVPKEEAISKIDSLVSNIKSELDQENFFDENDISVLNRLYSDTDYSNENIITISTNTASQIIDTQYDLLLDAQTELTKLCQPQLTVTLTMDNIFAIPEFKEWQGNFDIGNFVHVSMGKHDQYFLKLRISSLTWNPCVVENDFQIEFSNMIDYSGGRDDFAYILDETVNAAKNQITGKVKSDLDTSGIQVSDALIKALVNSNKFTGAISSGVFDTISANKGVFNELMTKSLNAQEIMANSGVFKTINTGSTTSKVVLALDVDANRISVGTLSVDRLIIRGTNNSIMYSMNNTLGTVSTETISAADYDKYFMNGNNIAANTIAADKILSHSITASKFVADDIRGVNGWINFSSGTFAFYGKHNIADQVIAKKKNIDELIESWKKLPEEKKNDKGEIIQPTEDQKKKYQFTIDFDFTVTDLGQEEIKSKISVLQKYTSDTNYSISELSKESLADFIISMEDYSLWLDLNDLIYKSKIAAKTLDEMSKEQLLSQLGISTDDSRREAKYSLLKNQFIPMKKGTYGSISWDGTKLSVTGDIYATSLTLGSNVSISTSNVSELDNTLSNYSSNIKNLIDYTTELNTNGLAFIVDKNGRIGQPLDGITVPTGTKGFFSVDKNGLLVAQNAVIYGTVYASNGEFTGTVRATQGTIGGWDIGSYSITGTAYEHAGGKKSDGSNPEKFRVYLCNGDNFHYDVNKRYGDYLCVQDLSHKGEGGSTEYPFYVRANGEMCASKAVLEGATVSGNITAEKIQVKDELLMYADGINKTTILSVSKEEDYPSVTIGNNNLYRVNIFNWANFGYIYYNKTNVGRYFNIDKSSNVSLFSVTSDQNADTITMDATVSIYKSLTCSNTASFKKDINIGTTLNVSGQAFVGGKLLLKEGYSNPSTGAVNARFCDDTDNDGYSRLAKTSSSSKRYKNLISNISSNDIQSLFNIPTYWFKYKDNYLSKSDERYKKKIPGFIVEDWEDIMPIAIDHNSDGSPEMWNSNIVIPLMFEMLKSEHRENEKLKQRIEYLEELANVKKK